MRIGRQRHSSDWKHAGAGVGVGCVAALFLLAISEPVSASVTCPKGTKKTRNSETSRVAGWDEEYCLKKVWGKWIRHGPYHFEKQTRGPVFRITTGGYRYGKKHGWWVTQSSIGTESIRYVNGTRHGGYEKRIGKALVVKGTYRRGRKHGTWTWYAGKGKVDKRCRFNSGRKTTCLGVKVCTGRIPVCAAAPTSGVQLAKLAYASLRKKKYGRCICLGLKALKTTGGWRVAATHYNVGQCWQRLGCTSQARDHYSKSVAKTKRKGALLRPRCRALKSVGGKHPRCK